MVAAAAVNSSLDAAALSGGQGLLVAAVDEQRRAAVLVASIPVTEGGDFQAAADGARALLPAGLHLVGSYSGGQQPAWLPRGSPAGVPTVTATNGDGAVAWSVDGHPQQGGLPPAAAAGAGGVLDIAAGFTPLRSHLAVEVEVVFADASKAASAGNGPAAANGAASKQQQQQQPVPPAAAVQAGVLQLSQRLLAQPQQLVFVVEPQQPGEAAAAQPTLLASSSSSTVQDALGAAAGSGCQPCVSLQPLQHTSQQQPGSRGPPAAPMFEFAPAGSQQQLLLRVPVSLDVLCYAPSGSSLAAVHSKLLVPALQQQLRAVEQQLLQQVAAGQPLAPVRALHFKPPGLGCPVTACYALPAGPQEAAEAKLLPVRQQLHALLGLPADRPMLRLANALAWGPGGADGLPPSARLANVHEALTPPNFGGSVYLVDGAYDYHHYMQDRFNDAGWGCAYRSLQTIVSWFRGQNYTSKPVPGHRQIQEILVAIGDKEPAFVGSSKWIGSFELSYILDEYLGVTCKTLAINQGADIPSHARALAQHFASQGTPVMIGGGVLAYTLLGVAFNEDTGEAAFLILDPHYTGGEDLKKITQGGWVAWKQLGDNAAAGGPLFVKDAFYNFLCPQRPCTV